MEKITLKHGITVNDKEVKELEFDTDLFLMQDFERANKNLAKLAKSFFIQETDPDYHFIIAAIIIEKSSKGEIMIEDLKRLKGSDIFAVTRAGRDFLLESAMLQDESLGAQSGTIADITG